MRQRGCGSARTAARTSSLASTLSTSRSIARTVVRGAPPNHDYSGMHIENGHTGGNTEMRSKKWTGTKFGNFSCKTMEGWYQNNQFRKQRTDHGDCEPNGSVQYERAKYKTYR